MAPSQPCRVCRNTVVAFGWKITSPIAPSSKMHYIDSKAGKIGLVRLERPPRHASTLPLCGSGDPPPPKGDGLDEEEGFKYILVMVDGMSNLVWVEPISACIACLSAPHLLTWCKDFRCIGFWVNDMASRFKTHIALWLPLILHSLLTGNLVVYGMCEHRCVRSFVPSRR